MKNDRKTILERQQNILNYVRQHGEAKVEDIARTFEISEMTVRRDLQFLHDQNLLCRIHGGAVSLANLQRTADVQTEVLICRRAISSYSSQFVEDGDSIFINGSLTALGLLDHIEDKQIDVYTNNGKALDAKYAEGVKIRLTGGELRGYVMVGDYVMRNLLELEVDKTFLGCAAVYDDGEFRYDIPTEIGINEAMISRTLKELYILADHSKLQRKANQIQSYGSIVYDHPFTLVTDEMADPEIVETLRSLNIKVITVPLE